MALITNDRIDDLMRRGEIEEALQQPVTKPDPESGGVGGFVRSRAGGACPKDDLAYAGLTLGDFLYDYIRINPDVVRGVRFARAADVDGILSFARFADAKANLSGASLDGLNSQLQGYVAEQVVAHHLIAQGHDVSFAGTPNNPGWDLTVDGHPFQVKCLADSGALYEHLQRYPNIAVIVNADLAGSVGDHAGVYVDPELHHDAIRHATEMTLDRGRAVADFEIPWISLGVSGAYNFYYMLKNDTNWAAMLTCTATDTAGRATGATAGNFAGAAAGSLLFGPAGVIVVGLVGTIGGAVVGRRLAARGRGVLVAEEEAGVRRAIGRTAESALSAFPEKLAAWKSKSSTVVQSFAGTTSNQCKVRRVMQRRLQDHVIYWDGKRTELERLARGWDESAPTQVTRLLNLIRRSGIHAHHVQDALTELATKLREYEDACKGFRTARR